MLDSDRRDRGALVVLWLLVGSIVFVSVVGLWARYEVEHHKGCPAYAEAAKQDEKELASSCFDNHQFFGDGYAQWAMTILASIATGASIWALVYLRRTLAETSRIGQAQTRAYLSVRDGSYEFVDGGNCSASINISNYGNSPASDVSVSWKVVAYVQKPGEGNLAFLHTVRIEADIGQSASPRVPQQNPAVVKIDFGIEDILHDGVADLMEHIGMGRKVRFTCRVKWWDVFDREQVEVFNLDSGAGKGRDEDVGYDHTLYIYSGTLHVNG